MSCLMTVTVLNFHHKGNHGAHVPGWVRKVFIDVLGTILCQKRAYYNNADKRGRLNTTVSFEFAKGDNNYIDVLYKEH